MSDFIDQFPGINVGDKLIISRIGSAHITRIVTVTHTTKRYLTADNTVFRRDNGDPKGVCFGFGMSQVRRPLPGELAIIGRQHLQRALHQKLCDILNDARGAEKITLEQLQAAAKALGVE